MSNAAFYQNDENTKRQQSLEAAFAFFNETSAQLAESYKALEAKVRQLSEDLDLSEAERVAETRKNTALETRMQALLDFLPGGVVVLDARGKVVQSNPAATKILGIEAEGKKWRTVIAESFAPQNDDGLEVSTRAGRRVIVSTSSLGEDGQIILLTDQTETRNLQAHLSRNERLSAMGKMVSALAHQIRTPLSAATLYVGHLCTDSLEPELHTRFANKALQRLQHMEKQVRDMMLFVKSELPLNDVISGFELEQQIRAASEVVLDETRIQSEWDNQAESIKIKCHSDALVSSIMNLINNAVQASDKVICVRLTMTEHWKHQKKYLQIAITDNGQGMSNETLAKIQEIFTTTKSQGTGLGLAVVRSVAKAHGAEFLLKSAEGKGTKAIINIPQFSN